MPLFGGPRDRALIRRINREVLQRMIGVEVAVYKLAPEETHTNIYDESSGKRYYNPVRVHALVEGLEATMDLNDVGMMDKHKELTIRFLRDDLVDMDLVMEESDIILWDGGYYEVDHVRSSTHWWGRNPDTSIPVEEGDVGDHGYTIYIAIDTHRTSIANLNLVETRSGNHRLKRKSKLPNNL